MANKTQTLAIAGAIIVILAIAGYAFLGPHGESQNKALSVSSNSVQNAGTTQVASPTQASGNKEKVTIRVPNESGTWVNLATIADAKGFFEEQGITLQWTGKIGGGGPGQLASIAGGSNDFGAAAVMAIINAQNSGVKIKAIAPEYVYDNESSGNWYVLDNSGITSAKDLIGKKIAVNTLKANQEWTIREYLRKYNIPISAVELVIVDTQKTGNPYLAEQVLRSGDVALISATEVTESKLLQTGGVKKLFSNYDVWGDNSGNPAYVVSDKFASEHPDTVKSFVAALAKAADFTNENPDEALKIIIQYNYPGIDAQAAKAIKAHHYPAHALISDSQVKSWIARMETEGDIKQGSITPADVYTNEYNPYYTKVN
ncbi:ABC transporter substrate-binding protein [Methanosphaerula subterraneus]|uniref:ABC transporter substrate-binding protein n=1 Tax=Methanosphaerula subterraneus TaxID=3350244 RepID=UPI003F86F0A5